jgi:peptide deformylase
MKSEELELLNFMDPRLYEKLPEFDFENPPINPVELKDALIEAMVRMEGVGLSANQVGLQYRVFVMGVPGNYTACFNPSLMGWSKEKVVIKEGCLSLPGVIVALSRPAMVVAKYQDETGTNFMKELEGIGARVFQHEMDHMEGRNFMMLASPLKQKRALEQLKKKVRNGQKLVTADIQ